MFAALLAQVQPSVPAGPITVAEAINTAVRYDGMVVTITGFLSVSEEWTRLTGVGCMKRLNASNLELVCAASLQLPDCSRTDKVCPPGLLDVVNEIRRLRSSRVEDSPKPISLTGKLGIAPQVFIPYSLSGEMPGLPKGEYRPMGFGHRNACPIKLIVTDGRVLPSGSPKKSPDARQK